MSPNPAMAQLSPSLRAAFEAKGFTTLTPVQEAVLDPALGARDLRITSQTGSGKTLAIGFAIRSFVEEAAAAAAAAGGWKASQKALALVIAPTRELAQQTQSELQWLYNRLGVKVVATTGGAGYVDELRALSRGPTIIVATPGRLLDHLRRGAIKTDGMRAVILDEADRMLDMGFREDLEAIFALVPKDRQTHLVSATFPHGVQALARKVQRDAAVVEGTRLGAANADIDHVLHLIHARDRVGAIVNLLLSQPGARTLVFARTRAGVADLAQELTHAGFMVSVLSGDLDQRARNRALAAFKANRTQVLVATDVAARGIDVEDVVRVIHAEPPTDADSYTHRSGRTGRAGRKGISSMLIPPSAVGQATRLLRMAGVVHRIEPIPGAQAIRKAADARLLEELTAAQGGAENTAKDPVDADTRAQALAAQVLESADPLRAVARLLVKVRATGGVEPRDVQALEAPKRGDRKGSDGPAGFPDRNARPTRGAAASARGPTHKRDAGRPLEAGFARFRVSWGSKDGAEPHRVLAMVCRRGGIAGKEVGPIRVGESSSVVAVAEHVAEKFAARAGLPDPRDATILITPEDGGVPAPRPARPPHAARPPVREAHERKTAPTAHERKPAPTAHERKPAPTAHERKPAPTAHERKPAPTAHERKPAPTAHERKPAPTAQERKPTPTAQERKPAPPAHERKPTPAAHGRKPGAGAHAPSSKMGGNKRPQRRSPEPVHTPQSPAPSPKRSPPASPPARPSYNKASKVKPHRKGKPPSRSG